MLDQCCLFLAIIDVRNQLYDNWQEYVFICKTDKSKQVKTGGQWYSNTLLSIPWPNNEIIFLPELVAPSLLFKISRIVLVRR
jgi:hypothetical protein